MGSPERAELLPVEPTNLWTSEDDELLLQLKWSVENLTWKEIADRFPRRTQGSCRKRYARILADMWDEQGRDRLAKLYDSQKEKMWQIIAQEMNVPSKDAEENHWLLGKGEMERRARDKSFRETWEKDFVAPDHDLHLAPPSVDDAVASAHQQQPQRRTRGRPWSGEEEASLFDHRATGKNWEDIRSLFPGRSVDSCPTYHRRVLNRAGGWSPELQTDLCRLYQERQSEMWAELAEQLAVQWQSAEAMHWMLGLKGMRERARFPQTVEPDEPVANPHELQALQPPNLMDCEPFDNCWETLMLNRDS
ncbi:hypothetical protein E4U32_007793 [Claviceps aff. humidiphila group G2b]|nr:hypothetical protein E4U32_007793 [Claviceps aff. humidiphila group G2b]